jgi:hypothetical protein
MSDHTRAETAGVRTRRDAWLRLRGVIADEYVGKLPELVPIDEFARITGMTMAQVRHATTIGDLVVSLRDGHRGIAPVDNIPFLLRERLLRLPAPAPRRRRRNARSLAVSPSAYERVWDEAVRRSISPQDALDRLLLVSADTSVPAASQA